MPVRSRGHGLFALTECPFCGAEISTGQGFADHWPKCSKNPAAAADGRAD